MKQTTLGYELAVSATQLAIQAEGRAGEANAGRLREAFEDACALLQRQALRNALDIFDDVMSETEIELQQMAKRPAARKAKH